MTIHHVHAQDMPESTTCGIQESINALGDQGGVVILPAGRHVLHRAIELRPRVTLRGQGPATILTRPPLIHHELTRNTLASDEVLHLPDTRGYRIGSQIRIMDDLQPMYHSREGVVVSLQDQSLSYALLYGEPQRVYRVENHAWVGNLFPAIVGRRVDDISIESLTIDAGDIELHEHRNGDFLGAAVHLFKCHNLRLRDLTIRRWPADGISVQGGSASVTGCVVEDCLGSGLHPGSAIKRSIWMGNIAKGNRDGFFFCSTVQNAIVANNVFIENRRHGIWGLGDPDMGNVVMGNVCAHNGQHGLEASRARGNVISGNLLRNNSQAKAGEYAAVLLQNHRDNLVAANLCLDDQAASTQTLGISSQSDVQTNVEVHNPHITTCPSDAHKPIHP